MHKVLIITYYWPPAGGSGVQRWLKFVKYFRDFGIEPIIYTVDKNAYPITDLSLENEVPHDVEVLKTPNKEPGNLLSFFNKWKQQSSGFLKSKPGIFTRFLYYLRANYFIPDARVRW